MVVAVDEYPLLVMLTAMRKLVDAIVFLRVWWNGPISLCDQRRASWWDK